MDSLKIATLNCQGQSGITTTKALFIDDLLSRMKYDILNLQETFIKEETFEHCGHIERFYNVISNNSPNNYGTACLVKNNLSFKDLRLDTEGRIIMFEINDFLFVNVYPKSGTDTTSRQTRENMFSSTLPNMIGFCRENMVLAGDWNCITENNDATHLPEIKTSPSLKRLIQTFDIKDDFRKIHGKSRVFSRYYSKQKTVAGGTRLDRIYSTKNLVAKTARYVPATISDHLLFEVTFDIHKSLKMCKIPKPKLPFKIRPGVINDSNFQKIIREQMKSWTQLKQTHNHDVLGWWENYIKPSIKRIAIESTCAKRKESKEYLNSLFLKQVYFCKKMREGCEKAEHKYRTVNLEILKWFENEAKLIQIQTNMNEITESESTNLYHHSVHRKKITNSAILTLDTEEGLKVGHKECA